MRVPGTTGRHRGAIAALAALLLAVAGCSDDRGSRDAAGATRQQVERMSLHEEFDLAGERYEHGQALLADAQARISDGVWTWNGGDVLPLPGDDVFGDVPDGATAENSYAFRTVRIIHPEEATGAAADLEPMDQRHRCARRGDRSPRPGGLPRGVCSRGVRALPEVE